ncbi:MAG: hypothetical protein ACR2LR_16230 [Hassallia sp.]
MKHVKWKSLALYALTIVAVMVLLKAISIYGESNLKAALDRQRSLSHVR